VAGPAAYFGHPEKDGFPVAFERAKRVSNLTRQMEKALATYQKLRRAIAQLEGQLAKRLQAVTNTPRHMTLLIGDERGRAAAAKSSSMLLHTSRRSLYTEE
jgi:hypothetical protein